MDYKYLKSEVTQPASAASGVSDVVGEILAAVREEGDAAVTRYSGKFDGVESPHYRVSEREKSAAKSKLPAEIVEGLDFAMRQVRKFAEAQRETIVDLDTEFLPGLRMGHRVVPVESCACYVPAGRYPCLTSAVMSVMPAKVAGVERIVACSPPAPDGTMNPAILYTLVEMGVDEIYCFGGAQAIGAFAYGTESIQAVDLIVGPGNQFVADAKRQVFGRVGIDLIAGPSECLVLADHTARAELIAADLIAQCEHDPNARGALVTTDEDLGEACVAEIESQLRDRTTEDTARSSWEANGQVVIARSMEAAVDFVNDYAPEHLELHLEDVESAVPSLHSYGSLFLGEDSAEVYADKIAGVNHILPTGRNARFSGGLWVGTFLKVITHLKSTGAAAIQLARYAELQSSYEGMDGHRFAAAIRLDDKGIAPRKLPPRPA